MINRQYFISAKVTDSTGYCFSSKLCSFKSLFSNSDKVYCEATDKLRAELLAIRPDGQFEVIAFNRV